MFRRLVSYVPSLPHQSMSPLFVFTIYHNPLDPSALAVLGTGKPFTLAHQTKILDCDLQTAASHIHRLLHDGFITTQIDSCIFKRCSLVNIFHTMLLSSTTLYTLYN